MDVQKYFEDLDSPEYIQWAKTHNNGSLEEYHQYLRQQNYAYQQTPEYQISVLRGEVHSLQSQVETLEEENRNLNEEIEYKDELYSNLEGTFHTVSFIGLILFILVIFMAIKMIKSKKHTKAE